ncbi:hypothetical protein [Acidimangrovimonas pyrenivorans]|uniref:Uncharacterized protein n=1 Tax=Acidimangrovimonas pyrenivorans TaxID=2030798 RepID=A0ABV7AK92_9RHOB
MTFAKTIAASLAGAVALAGITAAPAQANDRDVIRFLAGATALAIIASAANDHRDRAVPQHRRHVAPPPPRRVVKEYIYVQPRPRVVKKYVYVQPQRRVIVERKRTVVIDRRDRHDWSHNRHYDRHDWRRY